MSHKKTRRIDPLTLALPSGGADSHAHLDGIEFDADREDVLRRAKAAGLDRIGNVFLGPEDFAVRKSMFDGHPEVFFLLGIHPCDGMRCTRQSLAEMRAAFAAAPRLRAVGEIGLDYHWKNCPKELQIKAFVSQLAMARELGMPVALHCREAEDETLCILESRGFQGYPLLWHCFTGGPALADHILGNGWHISLPGPVTYTANEELRKAVARIPADRLLLETDCPYLPPLPWRGSRNEPAFTVFTAHALALARDASPEEVWRTCGDNARRFFGLF
ncbi:TatD family hydrolase [Candidatus Desulfovibrio trichonymphae]|uniref:Mg-dependent DNase n=1 Tax=Candidatus Desulfovibrio trichonymphae TaxID=1725232 RepID=A0A1J1DUZ2_9BACT|nr:TatD family hydrolase [Candidatus Desulfovibrio trichonymphae]BAV91612.1 Mg-dependent DNase [Candidatus Desulfovibrio trichonymphae]GHU98590.1 TatD family hydrolase [Deltaproteobacteria bacterium]